MATNKMLAPADGLTIRQPTEMGLKKGNIQNPPRYTNLAMGGLDSSAAVGLDASEFGQKPPGETIRGNVNIKGSKD
jgi:hypothetical protein